MSRVVNLAEAQHFADRLQAELDRKGWTAQDLVRAWGGSSMPYKWLRGRTAPRADTKRRLAETLGISMMALDPTPPNGQVTEMGEPKLLASRPITSFAEPSTVVIGLVDGGPAQSKTVLRLKVDALVTPAVASAVMRALEGAGRSKRGVEQQS